MSQLFVSFSVFDEDLAFELTDWLEEQGWQDLELSHSPVWNEEDKLPVDEDMFKNAKRCDAALFVVTPNWIESEWCRGQFQKISDLGKPLLALICQKTKLEEIEQVILGEWSVFDFTDFENPFSLPSSNKNTDKEGDVGSLDNLLSDLNTKLLNLALGPEYLPWPPSSNPNRVPYRGVKPYEQSDGGVFFGRDELIVEMVDTVRCLRKENGTHVLLLKGEVGVGKTSAMQAGLLSRLEWDSDNFIVLPAINPVAGVIHGHEGLLQSVGSTLAQLGLQDHPQRLAAAYVASLQNVGLKSSANSETNNTTSETLMVLLKEIAQQAQLQVNSGIPVSIIIAIDQMGDLFSQGDIQQNLEIKLILNGLLEQLDVSLILVGTAHTDEIECIRDKLLHGRTTLNEIDVPPLAMGSYLQISTKPFERCLIQNQVPKLEDALIDQLMGDVERSSDLNTLAMASVVLEHLFQAAKKGNALNRELYEKFGGLTGIIAHKLTVEVPALIVKNSRQPVLDERVLKSLIPWIGRYVSPIGKVMGNCVSISKFPHKLLPVARQMEAANLLWSSSLTTSADYGQTLECEDVILGPSCLVNCDFSPLEPFVPPVLQQLKSINTLELAAQNWIEKEKRTVPLEHQSDEFLKLEAATFSNSIKGYFDQLHREYIQTYRQQLNAILESKVDKHSKQTVAMRWITSVCLLIMSLAVGFGIERKNETVAAHKVLKQEESNRITAEQLLILAEKERDDAEFQKSQYQFQESLVKKRLLQSNVNLAESLMERIEKSNVPVDPQLKTNILLEAANLIHSVDAGVDILSRATERLLEVEPLDQLLTSIADDEAFEAAILSPDNIRILTLSRNGPPILWDAVSGVRLQELSGHESDVTTAAFSPDGRKVVTGSFDTTARIWNVEDGKLLAELPGHALSVSHVDFSPDGKMVVTASLDSSSIIWDVQTGAILFRQFGHVGNVNHATFSSDSRYLATSADDARIWSTTTGNLVFRAKTHVEAINFSNFSHDGKYLITASDDGFAMVWEVPTGRTIGKLGPHKGPVKKALFSPDGKSVLTISTGKTSTLWRGRNLNEQVRLAGHDGAITDAAFNPSGDKVITASADKTARLWDAKDGEFLTVFAASNLPVHSTAFSSDGQRIITGSNSVNIWKTARISNREGKKNPLTSHQTLAYFNAKKLINLTPEERRAFNVSSVFVAQPIETANACDDIGIDPLESEVIGTPISLEELAFVHRDAILVCNAEHKRRPKSGHFLHQIGRAYLSANNVGQASEYFTRASDLGHLPALYRLAELAERAGKPFKALKLYDTAIELGYPPAAFRAGEVHWQAAGVSKNPANALRYWKSGAEIGSPGSHLALGKLYATGELIDQNPIENSDFKHALHHFLQAVQLFKGMKRSDKTEIAQKRAGTIARYLEKDQVLKIIGSGSVKKISESN